METINDDALEIRATIVPKISFATHQNSVPVVRNLTLVNHGTATIEQVTISIASEPAVFMPRNWQIERLAPGEERTITDLDIKLDVNTLLQLNEAVRASVKVDARSEALSAPSAATLHIPVEVLARNEWGGASAMAELLAAFVQPNDPIIDRTLKAASEVLRRSNKPDAIDGYQSNSRTRIFELVSSIWSVVAGHRFTYASPPASFELAGQKIRMPSQIGESGLATCLDTAILFASAYEQAGLHPLIILTKGHAFVGVWLQPRDLVNVIISDPMELRKRIALNELVVLETTLATGSAPVPFSRAIEAAKRLLDEESESEFVLALDIRRARMQSIRPLAFIAPNAVVEQFKQAAPAATVEDRLEESPELPEFVMREPEERPSTPEGRLERWQRKLLDLSLRNRLLNTKIGTGTIRFICPDIARVEDRLAEGKRFRIVPTPSLDGAAGRDSTLHTQRTGEMLDVAYAKEALERDEIVAALSPETLDVQLVDIYRKARAALAEGGANTLFLAIGFLAWKRSVDDDTKPYRAPLILLPVKLERQSVRSGVRLSLHEDETRFNLTLLQMLKQDFGLQIPELADGLPLDESGVDIRKTLDIMRRAVRDTPGFEVVEDVLLGSFSFAKYLMWKDLVDRTDSLRENPVVKHLLETPREPYASSGVSLKPEVLDYETSPSDIFTPLSADSSQLAAVVSSGRGCDFVLDGPPGTGKSQTIANMIAHNLALGRKVLFVAEKRAALEVVHRRLVARDLGPFCLELHSNKASKSDVLRQLDSAWSTSVNSPVEAWQRRASELKITRDRLNAFVNALHQRHANGLSLYGAIGRVVRDGLRNAISLGWSNTINHSEEQLNELREAVRKLDLHRPADLELVRVALTDVKQTEWSNGWQSNFIEASVQLQAASANLKRTCEQFSTQLDVDFSRDAHHLSQAQQLATAIVSAGERSLSFALETNATEIMTSTREASSLLTEFRKEQAALTARLSLERLRALPLAAIEAAWLAAQKAIWPLSVFQKKAVARQISPTGDANPETDIPLLHSLQTRLHRLDALTPLMKAMPGWSGLNTNVAEIDPTLERAEALRKALANVTDQAEIRSAITRRLTTAFDGNGNAPISETPLGKSANAFIAALASFRAQVVTFETLAGSSDGMPGNDLTEAASSRAALIVEHAAQLNGWAAWQRACMSAEALQLGAIVQAVDSGTISKGNAVEAFDLAYQRWWAEHKIDSEPLLRNFSLAEQTDSIALFQDLDRQFAELTKLYIRAQLAGNIPPKDAKDQPAGFSKLAHQLGLKKSKKPVRQLLAEMGPALTMLAPCVLMSPLSVAQFLPADAELFDLVIFDEASQITPWDALGAIARGRQLVLAGDPKQMPPTNFFNRGSSDVDEDDDDVDMESILDECRSARLPERRLTWHYRSRNESLIAFSNHRYYDGDLITFPAPVTTDCAVSLRRIDGVWSRGKNRTNQPEAEAVVAEVIARLSDPAFVDENKRPLSLLVITLNSEQQRLIEDLLDQARRGQPELERFFLEDAAEPVVVKNLETVQGDERDVVLLSIAYGPETLGAPDMKMNFGPLNRAGGARRLNVAITRARREMVVFTSFPTAYIDLTRTKAEAVRDLKHFLEFAERGPRALGEAVAGSLGGYESPFEEAVARGLRSRGWSVVPQIGVSRFRIDLGIVHPDSVGDFLAGVECDGASYHSAATARDRDKVRAEILRGLGWHLERVWSTDWWIDASGAIERLDAALKKQLAHSRSLIVSTRMAEAASKLKAAEIAPALGSVDAPVTTYRRTAFDVLSARINPLLFDAPEYTSVLRAMIDRIVDCEAPILLSTVVEQIARAHGFKRSGPKISERIHEIVKAATFLETENEDSIFVWRNEAASREWRKARYPSTLDDVRSIDEIALAELAAALSACTSDDPYQEVIRAFGIRRLTATARERLQQAEMRQNRISTN